jgi:hypothetical protein
MGGSTIADAREDRAALFAKRQDPTTQPEFSARVADDVD